MKSCVPAAVTHCAWNSLTCQTSSTVNIINVAGVESFGYQLGEYGRVSEVPTGVTDPKISGYAAIFVSLTPLGSFIWWPPCNGTFHFLLMFHIQQEQLLKLPSDIFIIFQASLRNSLYFQLPRNQPNEYLSPFWFSVSGSYCRISQILFCDYLNLT